MDGDLLNCELQDSYTVLGGLHGPSSVAVQDVPSIQAA
jgi:hypothetical protein